MFDPDCKFIEVAEHRALSVISAQNNFDSCEHGQRVKIFLHVTTVRLDTTNIRCQGCC